MFVDTHCHLTMMAKKDWNGQFVADEHMPVVDSILQQAKKTGVEKIITVATTLPDSRDSVLIAQNHETVFATVGIHPCDAQESWTADFEEIKKLVANKKENNIIGIGEVGLDFYHKPFFKQRQIDVFKAHIELSLEHALPLVIHMRESTEEVLHVIEEYKNDATGVFHCYCHPADVVQTIVAWGMYIGLGGPLTYPKNDWLRELVADVSLEKIVLETDAPFLPPQQFRGQRNNPQYIPLIAQALAEVKGIEVSVVEDQTTANVKKIFGI